MNEEKEGIRRRKENKRERRRVVSGRERGERRKRRREEGRKGEGDWTRKPDQLTSNQMSSGSVGKVSSPLLRPPVP